MFVPLQAIPCALSSVSFCSIKKTTKRTALTFCYVSLYSQKSEV